MLGKLLFRFLGKYAQCAQITLEQHKRRFPLVPKVHMIAHSAHELLSQSDRLAWAENPLSTTNQIQEDFIGRPSRISRRVSIRSIHKSLFLRSLIMYQESFQLADFDMRGMDGYPDL